MHLVAQLVASIKKMKESYKKSLVLIKNRDFLIDHLHTILYQKV